MKKDPESFPVFQMIFPEKRIGYIRVKSLIYGYVTVMLRNGYVTVLDGYVTVCNGGRR